MKVICLLLPFMSHYKYKVLPLGKFSYQASISVFNCSKHSYDTVMIHDFKSSSIKIMLFVFKCKTLALILWSIQTVGYIFSWWRITVT